MSAFAACAPCYAPGPWMPWRLTASMHALTVKEQEFGTALERALGLQIEAVAAAQNAVRGGTLAVAVSMINHSSHTIALESVYLKAPTGWQVAPPPFQETLLAPQQGAELAFQVTIPADAPLTQALLA